MQNMYMRVFRSALSVACLVVGVLLVLRLLGVLTVIPHGIKHWWPVLPGVAGGAILARSFITRPFRMGPHIVVSASLILISGLTFATTRRYIPERAWAFAGAGGLIIAGVMLAWRSVKTGPAPDNDRSTVKMILFRTETFVPTSPELEHLKIFLLCGNIELDLRNSVTPDAPRDVLAIDITVCIGKVRIMVLPGIKVMNHKALVVGLTRRMQKNIYREDYEITQDVIAASLVFFGEVGIQVRTADGLLISASDAHGALPGPAGHAPATQ